MEKRIVLLTRVSWAVAGLALLPAIIAWLQGMGPGLVGLTQVDLYAVFPLLGLMAFTLMWSHYIVGALRRRLGVDKEATRRFRVVTGWVVLVAIVLHPGLLVYGLWRDGFGLPPDSYSAYVAPQLMWAVSLGVASLLAFLAYELHRWFADRKWWRFVQYAGDAAMLAIIIHGLRLGSDLVSGWFRAVWFVYALSYIAALSYTYYKDWHDRRSPIYDRIDHKR